MKAGGALFVSLVLPVRLIGRTKTAENQVSMDPTLLASWLEIRSDNTIVARTGRTETGSGITGYYAQAIAEALNVRPETITLIMGDTDRTPDGGFSAGFLNGVYNVRKVAAYTYQALLELAATKLGVPKSSVGNEEITGMTENELSDWRARHIGLVFQFYNLIPVLTAFENVEHTYTTLLTQNNEEVKVVQELLRHANSRMTLNLYAQAGMPNKRLAQSKLVRMVLNKGEPLA